MSLAAALKKGMDAVDGLDEWDPFPDQSDTSRPANANSSRTGKNMMAPRQAPREDVFLRRDPGQGKVARLPAKPRRAEGKAQWLESGVKVNPAQFVRELERFASEESKRAVADAVMDVKPVEIEGVAKLAARIKGRYLAKLLDCGNPTKSGVQETEIKELTRYRETFEELNRGLDTLKAAIESGDITLSGAINR